MVSDRQGSRTYLHNVGNTGDDLYEGFGNVLIHIIYIVLIKRLWIIISFGHHE